MLPRLACVNDITQAAAAIKSGGVVAYPTEGVYGLGCNPLNQNAVERLISIKQRDIGRGFILIAANLQQLKPLLLEVDDALQRKLDHDWPGPVTWILKHNHVMPALVHGNRDTIAVRVTAHAAAARLCELCGYAIISSSANLSGQPPCASASEVETVFTDQLDFILDAPLGNLGTPTPIFDGESGAQLR